MKINKPCLEDWDKMEVGMISRHCKSCQKNVYDFTNSSKSEIILKLLNSPSQSVCGRVRKDQLDFHYEEFEKTAFNLGVKQPRLAFAVLLALSLSLYSCSEEEAKPLIETTTEDLKPSEIKPEFEEFSAEKNEALKKNSDSLLSIYRIDKKKQLEEEKRRRDWIARARKNMKPFIINGEAVVWEPAGPYIVDIEVVTLGVIQLDTLIEPIVEVDVNQQNLIAGLNEHIQKSMPKPPIPKVNVEEMPYYREGVVALFDRIKTDLNIPDTLDEEMTIYASFVVEMDGKLRDVRFPKGENISTELKKEITRVLENMPSWVPGRENGEKVRVRYMLPFRIGIQGEI